jgi:hypothetical protein
MERIASSGRSQADGVVIEGDDRQQGRGSGRKVTLGLPAHVPAKSGYDERGARVLDGCYGHSVASDRDMGRERRPLVDGARCGHPSTLEVENLGQPVVMMVV